VKSYKEKEKEWRERGIVGQEEAASRAGDHEHIGGLWELDLPKLSHYEGDPLLSICKPDGSDFV
jgi:hypothetical protein